MRGEESTLGALLDATRGSIKTGPFGTKLKASEYTAAGVPAISVGEGGFGRLRIHHDTPRVDETITSRMPEFLLKAGDIVFGRKGAVERSAQVQPEEDGYFLGSDGIRVRLNVEECDPKFISYQLLTKAHSNWMIQHAAGTTMPSLNEGIIRRIPIVLKPLPEQRAIASVLGSLDDKIELNRRMNATLEAMARALFQSWFVDFDPVRRNADRDPNQPSTRPGGHPSPTGRRDGDEGLVGHDKLFPDSFQDSELGRIPKGWEIRSLDKAAHYLNGLALQKYPTGDGPTLPVIKIAQLRKGDSIGSDRCNTDLPPNYIVQDGDVLFSWSGSLEVELWCGGPGALNQHLFKVTSPEFPKWFYYLWTLHHLDDFRLIAADKATTMGHIQRGHLTAAKVLIPPRPLLDAMTRDLSPLIDQLIANRIQSRTLATLRETLLPKLLSGEIGPELCL
jgi:type I restriction enzyme S subunit